MNTVAYKGLPNPATYLSPRNADRTIALSLAVQLWLKYGERGGRNLRDLPDVAALRAEPSRALDDQGIVTSELCYVASKGHRYRWSRFAALADDGDAVIQPADVVAGQAGRWLKAPFRDFERRWYLKTVELCEDRIPFRSPEDENGQPIGPSLLQLCEGKLPAVFICFAGKDAPMEASQIPVAQDLRHLKFNIKALSANFRGQAGRLGSPDAAEAEADPGASAIIGDVEWYLRAYNNLNGTVGLGRMKIGEHRPVGQFGQEHVLMDMLPVRALVTIEVPNEPQDLIRPDVLHVQVQQLVQDDPQQRQNIGDPLQVRVNSP